MEDRDNRVASFAILYLLSSILASSVHAAPRLYVSNERGNSVSVIDTANNRVVATVPVGKRPRGIKVSPDGARVYVALSGTPITPPGQKQDIQLPSDRKADGIGVIDAVSLKLTEMLPSGTDPESFALSLDGKQMYISNEDANSATILDTASSKPLKTLKVGSEPEGVALTPDGKFVYITSETTNQLHVIDARSDDVIAIVKTAQRPRGVAFTPDSRKAYVTCETAGIICVVDTVSHAVTKQIDANLFGRATHPADSAAASTRPSPQRPMGIAMSPDGSRAYVTTGRGGALLVIDTAADEIVKMLEQVGARPWGVAVSPGGETIYTANGPSDDVSVIDASSLHVKTRIPGGQSPWGVALDFSTASR